MRAFLSAAVVTVGLFSATHVSAAPVPGFEDNYAANYAACVLPDGTVEACEDAINAHVAALLGGSVNEVDANNSFSALRREVFVANEPDPVFQAQIDALFEQLLPESGAVRLGNGGGSGGSGGIDFPAIPGSDS